MARIRSFLPSVILCCLLLGGCQSPAGSSSPAPDTILLSAQHCLQERLPDMNNRVHFGPCLKIISVNGQPPQVRPDGFIELPVRTALDLKVSCVYRHADGTPIPATVETADFPVTEDTFRRGGKRWYLHAHVRAQNGVGCRPTLSPSLYPEQQSR